MFSDPNYIEAMNQLDDSLCLKITNTDAQNQCKSNVSDQKMLIDAENKMDKSLCSPINSAAIKQNCETQVAGLEAVQPKTQMSSSANQTIMDQAIASQDGTKCQALNDPNVIASCQYNVYTNMASQKNNPTLCMKITNQDMEKACEQAVQKK